jgi:hypothetical protein
MTTTTEAPTKIDLYDSAEARSPAGSLTLADLIDAIRSDEFQNQVLELRAMLAANDEDGYAKAKRMLQAVSISGEVTRGARKAAISEGRFAHSGFLQLDFDAKDNVGWTVEEIREILQADPRVVAAFRSPSGDGVKAVARIPQCQTPEQHKAAFILAETEYAKAHLTIDTACKDPGRLCFVSWDPEAWVDLSRTAMFDPGEVVAESQPLLKPVQSNSPGRLILRDKHGPFPEPPHSGIHTWLMQAAWWCRLNDMTEHETVERLRSYDGTLRRSLQPTEAVDAARAVFSSQLNNPDWQIEQRVAAMLNPPAGSTGKSFKPEDVFYDAPSGKYLIRQGNGYAIHSKRGPVVTGITRHLAGEHESAKELTAAVKAAIDDREIDGAVQWSGVIAGHRQGIMLDNNGQQILITGEPILPQPAEGDTPLIDSIISQAFPNDTAMDVFISWLSGRYKAVRSYTHIPSPMMVLAGEINSGKSLLAWTVAQLLGGRTANPYEAWSGGILWNDDLVGSEFLLIDDCTGHTDIRARRAFGAAFKGSIYPHMIQLRKRHSSSISVRPVWCCMLCCNDTPEALQIIPPLDADVADKIAILHVHRIALPIDTSTPEGKKQLQIAIRQELPSLADRLMQWEVPTHLHDTRSGVIAWRDPELVDWVDSHSPARRLEELLEIAIEDMGLWHDLPAELTALDVEARLTNTHSKVRDQAKALFSWHGACGSALSRLAKMDRGQVKLGTPDIHKKINRYIITGEKS